MQLGDRRWNQKHPGRIFTLLYYIPHQLDEVPDISCHYYPLVLYCLLQYLRICSSEHSNFPYVDGIESHPGQLIGDTIMNVLIQQEAEFAGHSVSPDMSCSRRRFSARCSSIVSGNSR